MRTILLSLILSASALATTVTSITCSGQTATVNATAHGLIASQGFELSGTAPQFNGTAATVTTNAFTFLVPTGTPCSTYTSGYTAVGPAQQIIEQAGFPNPSAATVTIHPIYWFTTQFPVPLSCTPSCPTSQWAGANAAQNAAIVAGTTVELTGNIIVPATTTALTLQGLVQSQYTAMQVGFANFLLAAGYCWNGTTWATGCQ